MDIQKMGIFQVYPRFGRYRQILMVLFRYGFGDLLESLKVGQYLGLRRLSRKRQREMEALSREERFRMVLEELGPTFIKMGQFLSTRPDLIPEDFLAELEKLQDRAPPFPLEQARQTVEEELGSSMDTFFDSFHESPLAAASIGQVHQATLRGGESVVVKVQRPGIQRVVEVDLSILNHLALLAEKHLEGWDLYNLTGMVKEFSTSIRREMDYNLEAGNMEQFEAMFSGDPTVYVPRVYRSFTTRRLLTVEYIRGIKASETGSLQEAGYKLPRVAERGANLLLKQIFHFGFFHADPHPGNVFILPGEVFCFVDFGITGRLDRQTREHFVDLVYGITRRDEEQVTETILKIVYREEEPDRRLLERDVADFMGRHLYRPLKELEVGRMIQELFQLVSRHRIYFQSDLFLMLKAVVTMESLGRSLYPDFQITEHIAPFVQQMRTERYDPRRVARDTFDYTQNMLRLFKDIPGDFRELFSQLRQGRIKIQFEHRGLSRMLTTYEQISNRIAFSIVLASLIIGSSLIVLSGIPPRWLEIPIIGIVGFLAAGVLGFWLLISILRHGRF